MKEFIEKLIGRLEEARQECQKLQKTTTDAYGYMKQKQGIDVAKEIVNELAEEYKGGWIPVLERLPSEEGKYLVTVKNLTGYWILENNVFVCDYQFDDFIFQGWEDNKVIAWQPLPQPYKENENGKV